MTLTERLIIWRAEFVLWRASRRAGRQLRRDLAQYSTPAQRADLLATLDRYPDAATAEMRDILTRGMSAPPRNLHAWPGRPSR